MKRRGWWIVAGLALLWTAPAVFTLIRSQSTPKEDQTKAWAAYFRAERKRQHDYAMEVYRGKYYSGSYGASCQSSRSEPEVEVVVVERPVYIEREAPIPDYQPRRQPDLTGFYSTIPMTGPNAGELQINSVIGPF